MEATKEVSALIADADVVEVQDDSAEGTMCPEPREPLTVIEGVLDDSLDGPPSPEPWSFPAVLDECQRCKELEQEVCDLSKKVQEMEGRIARLPNIDQENVPPAPVIESFSVTSSSAKVTWEELHGEARFYGAIGNRPLVSLGQTRSHTFSGLEPATDYTISIQVAIEGTKSPPATQRVIIAKPRAGKVKAEVASSFQMVELLKGTGVHLYPAQQAMPDGTTIAASQCLTYLVAIFFTRSELEVSNLTGQNGKAALDGAVLEAISAYRAERFKVEPKTTRRTIGQKCQDAGREKGEKKAKDKKRKPLTAKFIQESSSDDSDIEG